MVRLLEGWNICFCKEWLKFMINANLDVGKYPTHRASETIHAAKYSHGEHLGKNLVACHHGRIMCHTIGKMKLPLSSGPMTLCLVVPPPLAVPPFGKTWWSQRLIKTSSNQPPVPGKGKPITSWKPKKLNLCRTTCCTCRILSNPPPT